MARVVVIGGGMSGLSLGYFIRQMRPDWELAVLEAENRAGGKAWTVEQEGFVIERGVNGVLDNKPSTLDLAESVGLRPLRSFDTSRKRFVVKDGRLVKLPEGAGEFLKTPLLSPCGKLRVMAELFVPRGDLSRDESLEEFATRRLGRQTLERLIDAMSTGIYAGDSSRLSLKSCFPRIYELERDYGGLIKAMLTLQIEARKKGGKGPGAGPGGTLTSFDRGMSELADAVARSLGSSFRPGHCVEGVEPAKYGWLVHLKGGKSMEATHVAFACPATQAGNLLRPLNPEAADIISNIYYPPVAVVALGFRKGSLPRELDGFGFLCPGRERRKILGCLWDSSIFKGRAPEGYELLRVLAGGARMPQLVTLSDEELLHIVRKDLGDLMGLKAAPDFISIFRWDKAIPQYEVGYADSMERFFRSMAPYKNLYFRCNWVGGVSLNDCVANSRSVAESMAA